MGGDVEFFKRNLLQWFDENSREFPWRDDGAKPYEILVGEIMLQKTRAENVVEVYRDFIKRYPDSRTLASANLEDIQDLVKALGLHQRRSKTLKEVGSRFAKDGVPRSEEELRSILGVGKYIANAFLSVAFGARKPIVDTNVKRIYSRFFSLAVKRDPRRDPQLWEFAESILPEQDTGKFNLAVLDLGAMVCKKENPNCSSCPLKEKCGWPRSKGIFRS